MNPHTPTTIANQSVYHRRSTTAVVIGVILVVASLFGLWIGISLTQPPNGFIDFSGTGHFFVVLSILVGGGGIWLVAIGSRPGDRATPDPSRTSSAAPPERYTDTEVGAAAQPAETATVPTGNDDRATTAGGAVTHSAAGRRLVVLATLGLAILVGVLVWHSSTVAPSMADRVQTATHANDVSCYLKGEINIGEGVRHQFQFYDCISRPSTSTTGPITLGCFVYYQGRLEDVTSRLAHDPNSWDTWNLFGAPPSTDPLGPDVCGSYAWG
jgi:hypothetical protein